MTANSVARPSLDDGDLTLYHGDCLEVLRSLPAGIAQTCVTSPPYWGLRSYLPDGHDDKATELGLEATPQEYVERIVEVFRQVRRVLREDGTLWLNLGDSYASSGIDGLQSAHANGRARGEARAPAKKLANQTTGRAPTPPGLKPKDLCGIPWAVAKAMQEPYYTGKIRDERDRIWLAAIVEAEGCLFIHKRKAGQSNGQGYSRKNDSYGSGLEVSSTDRVIAERCMAITGLGSICEQTPQQNERRKQTIYRWNLRTNECRDVIRELYPHMIAKQHEARLLIGCPSSGVEARKAHESLKALHQGQAASIDFREPEGMWERGWFLRSEIIWAKCMPNPMPESVTDRPTKAHEYVFLFSKQPRYFFDADAVREPHSENAHHGLTMERASAMKQAAQTGGHGKGAAQIHLDPAGRNLRSVWQIATEPFPEAHFATYPQALVERCIKAGTSERGECSECGAPWRRDVEKIGEKVTHVGARYPSEAARVASTTGPNGQYREHGAELGRRERIVSGWEPSCSCRPNGMGMSAGRDYETRPQLVLDPFVGSGTTSLVARKHGRRSIGIDLSLEYLAIAAKRTQQLSLLGGAS